MREWKALHPLGYFDSSEVFVTLQNPSTNILRALFSFVLVCLFGFLLAFPCLR